MVGRTLTADTDISPFLTAGLDGTCQEDLNGFVAFIEEVGNQSGIAVQTECQLGQVVGANRETVEVFKELLGKQCVARDFAHHIEAKTVHAALETLFVQTFVNFLGFLNGSDKRNHDFDVGQAHFVADFLQSFAFHSKAFFEVFGNVTACTAETEHGVFFFRFVELAA